MKPEAAEDAAMEVARWFAAEGVPAYVVYYDDAGWHMAGPPMPGPVLAEGFRKLATSASNNSRLRL